MNTPPILSPEAWEAARLEMLGKEKAFTRARDGRLGTIGTVAATRYATSLVPCGRSTAVSASCRRVQTASRPSHFTSKAKRVDGARIRCKC
jgi:hypothetical protein